MMISGVSKMEAALNPKCFSSKSAICGSFCNNLKFPKRRSYRRISTSASASLRRTFMVKPGPGGGCKLVIDFVSQDGDVVFEIPPGEDDEGMPAPPTVPAGVKRVNVNGVMMYFYDDGRDVVSDMFKDDLKEGMRFLRTKFMIETMTKIGVSLGVPPAVMVGVGLIVCKTQTDGLNTNYSQSGTNKKSPSKYPCSSYKGS